MAEAARDAQLNAWRAQETGLTPPEPISILVDNAAGVVFQSKMNPQSKLKGMIDLRWNWVKELQDQGKIKAVKVDTLYNVADLLTKCHGRIAFDRLLNIVDDAADKLAVECGVNQNIDE